MTEKKETSKLGRPTKMDEKTLNELKQAFLIGCTDEEACFSAGISRQTLHNYVKENPDFLDKKALWKTNPIKKARQVLIDQLDKGDDKIAMYLIDKADGKARQAMTLEGNPDAPLVVTMPSITINGNEIDFGFQKPVAKKPQEK